MSLNPNKKEWIDCTLGDVVTFKRGFDLPKDKMKEGKYPVVASNGIIGFHNEFTTDSPGITVGRSGNVGKPFLINERSWSHNTTLFIEKFKNVDPYFIYYYLRTIDLKQFAGGSAVPTLNRNHIHPIDIRIPQDIIEQKKIAYILSTIDAKIKLNNEINKNLNNLLELNFKKYLLNFENYSENELISSEYGLIPKCWSVSNLTMIADYQNGLAMQKFPPDNDEDAFKVLKIKELRQGFFDENSDICSKNIKEECIVYDGDVIFSWSGSLLVDLWTGGTCGLNQHLFKVTSSKFDKWFYYCWTKFYLNQFVLIAKDKATTMGHIKRQNLNESLVLIPDKLTYNKLTLFFEPIIDLIIKNKIEIKNLQKLRDTLLPKLMSGEIDLTKLSI